MKYVICRPIGHRVYFWNNTGWSFEQQNAQRYDHGDAETIARNMRADSLNARAIKDN